MSISETNAAQGFIRTVPDTSVSSAYSQIPTFQHNDSLNKSTPTTFKVFDVSLNNVQFFDFYEKKRFSSKSQMPTNDFSRIHSLLNAVSNPNIQILQGSENYNQSITNQHIKMARNGFVDTIIQAYVGHHNIVIRPDDVWLAIITQFSFYVNEHSEELRGHFVDFGGKKTLTVKLIDPEGKITINSVPTDLFLTKMMELVDNNLVDTEVRDWILPNFSTTTTTDRLTAGVTLLSTIKKYFEYHCGVSICGIPNVTLEGSVKDWSDIRSRVEKLRQYKLEKWVDMLGPVLDQFVRAKSGDVDVEFWKNICHHDYLRGRGGYVPDRTYIGGWVTVFCPLTKEGWLHDSFKSITEVSTISEPNSARRKPLRNLFPSESNVELKWPRIEIKEIAECYVDVEIIWNIHGIEYNTVFTGGHMGMEVLEDGVTLQPSPGWVFALKGDEPQDKDNGGRAGRTSFWRSPRCVLT